MLNAFEFGLLRDGVSVGRMPDLSPISARTQPDLSPNSARTQPSLSPNSARTQPSLTKLSPISARSFTVANTLECFKHSSLMASMKQTLLHGLFPAVRAEVLRLLFTNRGQELYTRELARLSCLALRTVQDELAKLEAANLILSRTNGYHRFYRANPKHPLCAGITEIVRKGVAHSRAKPRTMPSRRSGRAKRLQH